MSKKAIETSFTLAVVYGTSHGKYDDDVSKKGKNFRRPLYWLPVIEEVAGWHGEAVEIRWKTWQPKRRVLFLAQQRSAREMYITKTNDDDTLIRLSDDAGEGNILRSPGVWVSELAKAIIEYSWALKSGSLGGLKMLAVDLHPPYIFRVNSIP